MSANASEDALVAHLLKTRMVEAELINDARDSQKMAAEHGLKLPLAEALVKLGAITAAQRATLEKSLGEDQSPQLGNYKVIKKLGAGTMGNVYLAEDMGAQRKVALKILNKQLADSPEFLNRFQSEAQVMGKLNHVNIVSAFTVSHDKGKYFYAMEYCEGESLEDMLKREKVLSPGQALDIMKQVAGGLEHAHSRGLVHRDIKPANIMVTPDGVAKILDLGLSKNIANTNSFSTMSGMAVGTPHYMSPEQARGTGNVDGRADIYSMGATLYHLVCGRPPFEGTDPDVIINKQVTQKAPNPSDINPDIPEIVAQVIERMLAKSPDDRYQKCSALIADIDNVMNGRPPALIPLEASRSSVEMRGVKMTDAPPTTSPTPLPKKAVTTTSRSLRQEKVESHDHRRETRTKPKPRGALVIASILCVVGIGVLAMGVLTAMNSNPSSETDANKPAEKEPVDKGTPAATKTPAVTVSTQPAPPAQPAAVNLLKLIDPAKDSVNGAWQMQNGALVCAKSNGAARIELPYYPPDEYDMKIEFTRSEGNDTTIMSLTKNGQPFNLKIGDAQNTVIGFETISGTAAGGNKASIKLKQCYPNNVKQTAVVKVRNSNIKAYLNNTLVAEHNTNFTDMNVFGHWRLRDTRILGVGCYQSKVTFHAIELTEVTGKGKPAR